MSKQTEIDRLRREFIAEIKRVHPDKTSLGPEEATRVIARYKEALRQLSDPEASQKLDFEAMLSSGYAEKVEVETRDGETKVECGQCRFENLVPTEEVKDAQLFECFSCGFLMELDG
mgnify:CR=1 FL=1